MVCGAGLLLVRNARHVTVAAYQRILQDGAEKKSGLEMQPYG
jgi:hypothetical protein